MAKCLSNGLNYPFYTVTVWDWEKDDRKESGGEYCPNTILETEDYDKALHALEKVQISADRIQAEIKRDTGEDIEWVASKDEWNGLLTS